MFRSSFLKTLNIYKDYFKDYQRLRSCTSVKQSLVYARPETEFALIHISLEEAAVFVHHRVLLQGAS